MGDHSEKILEAVNEIRELIRIMAEPQIAVRDKNLRGELRRIVGRSVPKQKSVLLMDGTRNQVAIQRQTEMNKGNLSTLVKQLSESKLLVGDPKQPKLTISIPANFFEEDAETN